MKEFCLLAWISLFVAAGAMPLWGQVALLDSDVYTKEFFRRHYPNCSPPDSYYLGANEYQRYFRGWEYVLKNELLIPYTLIRDADVTAGGLAKYKLLILSNTASLTDDQTKAIDRWVNGGGRLLATFGSGYKDFVVDLHEDDLLKVQKGGTGGLHQLWHDPLSKLFSSALLDPGVDVRITDYSGPTSCLLGQLVNDVIPYGANANILIQRPEQYKSVLAFVVIDNPDWKRPAPAIISTRKNKGLVVYFSFAPEYLVSKEFDLPASLPCPDGQNWAGRSEKARSLMRCTIQYLLAN